MYTDVGTKGRFVTLSGTVKECTDAYYELQIAIQELEDGSTGGGGRRKENSRH